MPVPLLSKRTEAVLVVLAFVAVIGLQFAQPIPLWVLAIALASGLIGGFIPPVEGWNALGTGSHRAHLLRRGGGAERGASGLAVPDSGSVLSPGAGRLWCHLCSVRAPPARFACGLTSAWRGRALAAANASRTACVLVLRA